MYVYKTLANAYVYHTHAICVTRVMKCPYMYNVYIYLYMIDMILMFSACLFCPLYE